MTTNISEELNKIRALTNSVKEKKMRAEVEKEQAEARIQANTEKLMKSFKVDNVEDAKILLTKIQNKLQSSLTEAKVALDAAE